MELIFKKSHKDRTDIPVEAPDKPFDTIDYPIPQEGTITIWKSKTWIVDNIVYNYDTKTVIVFLIYTQGK